MKPLLILLIFFLSSGAAYAQFTTSSGVTSTNDKVGIKTTSPQAWLDNGKLLNSGELSTVMARLAEGNPGTFLGVRGYETQPASSSIPVNNVKSFAIEHNFYGYTNSAINFYRGVGETGGSIGFSTNNNTERMRLTSDGSLAIGTSDPKGYKLAVAGSVVAESVTVKLQSAWPDYVFKNDHPLRPLSEVAAYIKQNGHLPEIPTAAEVAKNGVSLGETNALLLKKIEELTLYLIEKSEKIEALQQSEKSKAMIFAKMERQVQYLKSQLDILKRK